MNCKHCGQPIQRCNYDALHGTYCRGWTHSASSLHGCVLGSNAEPEPGAPPVVEEPTGKPAGEVA